MKAILQTLNDIWRSKTIRKKILITLGLLALYRLLVFLPVPFVNIDNLANHSNMASSGLQYFAMLLG
jgi:preprotein translocase subunit SecY